jgi:high-affinity Fe2+/Pb2+ permease
LVPGYRGTMTRMYIGIGTVVLIVIIILIIMLLRRGI